MNVAFPSQSLVSYTGSGHSGNYADQRREAYLAAVPRMTFNLLDTYVAGARALAPVGAQAGGVLQTGSGLMAAGHALSGLAHLATAGQASDRHETVRQRAVGWGELITSMGYVGLSVGLGVWALPIVGLGLAVSNYAAFS